MKELIDWKKKYLELRRRFVSALDVAFRQGYEQGSIDMQLENFQQQMAQVHAPTQETSEEDDNQSTNNSNVTSQMQPQEPNDQELDQYISQLEEIINKNEVLNKNEDLKKSIEKIKNFSMNRHFTKSLRKISFLPKKIPARAAANLGSEGTKSVTLQEKIVNDILAKWEKESLNAENEIMRAVGTEPLLKEDG